MDNSTEKILMVLKSNFMKEKELYFEILKLANDFNNNIDFSPVDFLNYLSKRMEIEDKIKEIEDMISEEKDFWIKNKAVIRDSMLKQELSGVLKDLKDVMAKIVKLDGEIAKNMKIKGITLNNSSIKTVDMKRAINSYKKNK